MYTDILATIFFDSANIDNLTFGIFTYTLRPYFQILKIFFTTQGESCWVTNFFIWNQPPSVNYLVTIFSENIDKIKIWTCSFWVILVVLKIIYFEGNILVIYINLWTFIICKNSLNIINTIGIPNTSILYFYKTDFKEYYT